MPGLMFPKTGTTKKKRRSHPDSILQRKEEGYCYLCAMLRDDWRACSREEHHIFFSAHQRQLSEEYGLKVYLCSRHHREGKEAVHQNQKIRRMLEARGQQAFEAKYGHKKFIEVFGRNYIMEREE